MIIQFENGRSSVVEVNWITPMKVRKISLTCDSAFVDIDYMGQEIIVSSSDFIELDKPNQFQPKIQFESKTIAVEKGEPLLLEIQDFINSIENRGRPMVSVMDGILALRVAQAAQESLSTGEVVSIV
jgi:predicted dehydrogenase